MTDAERAQDRPVMAPTFRLQWEPAQGCHVILYPEGMVKLNPAAGEILSRCDGRRTVSEIVADLTAEYPDAAGLAEDVHSFLRTAHERQWIRWQSA
jgi:pyrroloquinoline quinone biosynthesis protein D